jgi:hypothetical protein
MDYLQGFLKSCADNWSIADHILLISQNSRIDNNGFLLQFNCSDTLNNSLKHFVERLLFNAISSSIDLLSWEKRGLTWKSSFPSDHFRFTFSITMLASWSRQYSRADTMRNRPFKRPIQLSEVHLIWFTGYKRCFFVRMYFNCVLRTWLPLIPNTPDGYHEMIKGIAVQTGNTFLDHFENANFQEGT